MSEEQERDKMVEDTWRMFLTEGRNTKEFKYRHLFSLLPSNPRCRFCNAQKWLRKSEQGDKWNRCLIEGMIVLSETGARDEQTTPP